MLVDTRERVIADKMSYDPRELQAHCARYIWSLSYCAKKRVLDAAMGSGYGTMMLSWVAEHVDGIDIHKPAVDYAYETYGNDRMTCWYGDVCDMPFESEQYDVVTSFETLEHLVNPYEMMSEVYRVLKPGGLWIVSEPFNSGSVYHKHEMTAEELVEFVGRVFTVDTWYTQGPTLEFVERGEPLWGHPTTVVVARKE